MCRHEWERQYESLVLTDGPNKGQTAGLVVYSHCPKCGTKTMRVAV
jgi:hypothetical protein